MKKALSILLLSVLVLSLCAGAYADNADTGVYFGEIQLKDGVYYSITDYSVPTLDEKGTALPADGFQLYYSSGILTLNGVDCATNGAVPGHIYNAMPTNPAKAAIYSSSDLSIVVAGTNMIYEKDGVEESAGICVDGSLTISGTGSLSAGCSGTAGAGCGIIATGDLSVSGSVIVLGTAAPDGSFPDGICGVTAGGNITVSGTPLVGTISTNATGNSFGIICGGNLTANTATVTAICTTDTTETSCGLSVNGSVALNSSVLSASSSTNGNPAAVSCGLTASSVTITGKHPSSPGAAITAGADSAATSSVGISAPVTVNTNGIQINSTGGQAFGSVPAAGTNSDYTVVLKADPSADPTSESSDANETICTGPSARVISYGKPSALPAATGTAPAAAGGDGAIAGLDPAKKYQYRQKDATEWQDVPASSESVTIPSAGTGKYYNVRYATDEANYIIAPDNYQTVYVPEYNKPLTLTLNPTTISSLAVGSTATIKATCSDSTAPITWRSEDTSKATVDSTGKVTGVAKCDSVKIYASAGGSVEEYATVTVVDAVVPTDLTISAKSTVTTKSNFQLTATVKPSNATGTVTWSSSDPDVLEVVETKNNGRTVVIKPHKNGTATISARINGLTPRTRTITVNIPSETKYKFLYRENSGSWYYDYSGTYTVKTDAPYGTISSISVYNRNNNLEYYALPGQDYTESYDENGNSIVKFTKAFMKTLPRGTYQTMTIKYTDGGKASAYLHILSVYDKPVTGDRSNAPIWALLVVSGIGTGVLAVSGRKKYFRRKG